MFTKQSIMLILYACNILEILKMDKMFVSMLDIMGLLKIAYVTYLVQHYKDVIMGPMASQITSLTIVYSSVYSGADQKKKNIEAPHHWPLCGEFTGHRYSPHKGSVPRKMFPFDDVIME